MKDTESTTVGGLANLSSPILVELRLKVALGEELAPERATPVVAHLSPPSWLG